MTMRSVLLCLLVCLPLEARAEELDELEALQITVRKAIERIEPCIVRITTVGGIRRVDVPTEFKPDDSAPERPREDDDDAREEDEEDEDDGDNEGRGRTPRPMRAAIPRSVMSFKAIFDASRRQVVRSTSSPSATTSRISA